MYLFIKSIDTRVFVYSSRGIFVSRTNDPNERKDHKREKKKKRNRKSRKKLMERVCPTASDPRLWSREDVATFLRWAEREFDLPQFDMDMFQMNGKALCLLTKADLGERCPGAGDVLHNVLSMLARDFSQLQRCLPSSPVTPTRPSAYPLSPHSHPPTPTWTENPYTANLASLMSANSVTLSPAPSVDSQAGSPGHTEGTQSQVYKSDSDEDNQQAANGSPPATPTALAAQRLSEVCVKDQPSPTLTQPMMPLTPGAFRTNPASAAREFFPSDSPEPNTSKWCFADISFKDFTSRVAFARRCFASDRTVIFPVRLIGTLVFVQEDSTALSSTSDDSSRRLHDEIRWYATLQRFRRTARIFQFSTLVLPCPDSECRVVNPTRCTARSLLAKRGKKRVLPTFARRRCPLFCIPTKNDEILVRGRAFYEALVCTIRI